jgi:sucrose phosphorylase
MKNQVHLIAYPNRLDGSTLSDLRKVLAGPFEGLFAGVHILPFFLPVNGADTGFDPIDHRMVDPSVGSWQDIRALGEQVDITADLIVNHVSIHSPQFKDFLLQGETSPSREIFLTYHDEFPQGGTEQDLVKIYRPRPGLPFTKYAFDGQSRMLWTTFTSEQVDINVNSDAGWNYLQSIMDTFADHGVRTIRLDAVGGDWACVERARIHHAPCVLGR